MLSKNSTGIITTTVHNTERKTSRTLYIIRTITFYIDSNCVLSCILITTEIFSAMFEGNSEKTKAPITISSWLMITRAIAACKTIRLNRFVYLSATREVQESGWLFLITTIPILAWLGTWTLASLALTTPFIHFF